jgi:hypothetical protein
LALFDVIAAGQNGQCFALMSRRFLISEDQAADAMRGLLRALLPGFEEWISDPEGFGEFLEAMSRGGYQVALSQGSIFSQRGQVLLSKFRRDLVAASRASGVAYPVLVQMLPFAALFLMAAIRAKAEQPMREILVQRLGRPARQTSDPFADLAALVAWEAKGHKAGLLAGVLDGLYRNLVAAAPAAIATS